MPPVLNKALRNRWFVVGLHACLWCLLYLAVANLRGKAPDYREADVTGNSPPSPAPVAGLERLFSPGVWPASLIETNTLNPFFTRYFAPPALPPPTTRKIEVTYQGFYQTANSLKQSIFKLGDTFVAAPVGTKIAPELFIADASMQAMTLTNVAAQTNIVPLNTKREIIVPIK